MDRQGTNQGASPKYLAPRKDKTSADVIHSKAMEAVGDMKFEKLRSLSYMPRTKETWASQFFLL